MRVFHSTTRRRWITFFCDLWGNVSTIISKNRVESGVIPSVCKRFISKLYSFQDVNMTLASCIISLSCLIPTGDVCSDCFYGCFAIRCPGVISPTIAFLIIINVEISCGWPIFLWKWVIHFQDSLVNRKFKEKHLFETERDGQLCGPMPALSYPLKPIIQRWFI